jgi:16S rRNA (guanine527-N7)-methyltransferase
VASISATLTQLVGGAVRRTEGDFVKKDEVYPQAAALGVSRESWTRIEAFVDLLLTWQTKTNLISPASIPHIWERHVIDSLQLLPLLPKQGVVADLGSGSGFPALPLAITSGLTFHLYESNNKKAAFLREALRITGCNGAVHAERLDGKPHGYPKVNAVTARALAPLSELLNWSHPFLETGAKAFFHKGENLAHELTEARKYWRIQSIEHRSLTDSQASILEIVEVSRA